VEKAYEWIGIFELFEECLVGMDGGSAGPGVPAGLGMGAGVLTAGANVMLQGPVVAPGQYTEVWYTGGGVGVSLPGYALVIILYRMLFVI
jgi:hypothetical protein